jgi:inorganic pyrophosphatase
MTSSLPSRSRGSRNKYEYDPELGGIVLDRRLFTSTVYPADYGFVDGTLAGDGDTLDALVLVGDPTFPGSGSESSGFFEWSTRRARTTSSCALEETREASRRNS